MAPRPSWPLCPQGLLALMPSQPVGTLNSQGTSVLPASQSSWHLGPHGLAILTRPQPSRHLRPHGVSVLTASSSSWAGDPCAPSILTGSWFVRRVCKALTAEQTPYSHGTSWLVTLTQLLVTVLLISGSKVIAKDYCSSFPCTPFRFSRITCS